jgi:5-bromo-4-chloroindolyl phosphate hydrolysis protein
MTWREKYMRDPELADSIITTLRSDLDEAEVRVKKLEYALERIRDCDFVITLPDRMDAVRAIAKEALE